MNNIIQMENICMLILSQLLVGLYKGITFLKFAQNIEIQRSYKDLDFKIELLEIHYIIFHIKCRSIMSNIRNI